MLVLASATSAYAQPANSREYRARELFAAGKYAEARDIYITLYAETPHPTYLRNIGRCYQNLGQPDEAISSFREYLRQAKDLTQSQRAQIEGYVREMDELKRKREASSASRPQSPAPSPTAAAPPSIARAQLAQTVPATTPPTLPAPPPGGAEPGRPPIEGARRVAVWAVGGASLAALGVAGYFGFRAHSKWQDSNPHCPDSRCDDTGYTLSQQAQTAARVADIAAGVGLVGAVVATYLLLTSTSSDAKASEDRGAHLGLDVAPGRAGLVVGASW